MSWRGGQSGKLIPRRGVLAEKVTGETRKEDNSLERPHRKDYTLKRGPDRKGYSLEIPDWKFDVLKKRSGRKNYFLERQEKEPPWQVVRQYRNSLVRKPCRKKKLLKLR